MAERDFFGDSDIVIVAYQHVFSAFQQCNETLLGSFSEQLVASGSENLVEPTFEYLPGQFCLTY